MQTAKFCIYCFWKPQKQFDSVKGVLKTEVGYIGGNKQNITYEECCSGETNACEAIIVEFDEKIISYKEIVTHFFNFLLTFSHKFKLSSNLNSIVINIKTATTPNKSIIFV